jgi:hypothetical protein
MSVRAFNLVSDVWKRVKKHIREELKRELGKNARTPRFIVQYDVEPTEDGKRRAAYYDPHRREIVISAKLIDELLEKFSERDVICKIMYMIFHELRHHINCMKRNNCDDEKSAHESGREWEMLCYADLV